MLQNKTLTDQLPEQIVSGTDLKRFRRDSSKLNACPSIGLKSNISSFVFEARFEYQKYFY